MISSWNCWIIIDQEKERSGTILRFFEFYIPLWAAIAMNFILYYKSSNFIKKLNASKDVSVLKRLQLYPLILVFCWFWGTINRIYSIFYKTPPIWLQGLHIFFGNLQGIINAIIYGLTGKVKALLREKFCGEKNEELPDNSELSSYSCNTQEDLPKN